MNPADAATKPSRIRPGAGGGFRASGNAAILTTVRGIVPGVALLCAPLAISDDKSATPSGFAERPEQEPYAELVDEDEEYATRRQVYAFNPVQARKELKVGLYYSKKGSHRAAAGRYLEATRWDTNLAEAYWRLGIAREKLSQSDEAIDAYTRFLNIEPTGKKAREVSKRLARLRQARGELPLAAQEGQPATAP